MAANIRVAVRVRPFTQAEQAQHYQNNFIEVDRRSKQIKVAVESAQHESLREYGFDCVLGQQASQEDVYRGCGIDFLVGRAIEGYNSTIFLYGQTGSGKTYTMQGQNVNDVGDGIVPRVVESLYGKMGQNNSRLFSVSISYLQIYCEKVFDLLNPLGINGKGSAQNLRLRWTKESQFTVENLFVFECQNAAELLQYVKQGLANRVNATHKLNISSSRSHSILSIRVDSKQRDNPDNILSSRIELVDLAGSERTSQTGSEGRLAKESIDINKSLFTLRQVITTLSEDPSGHIPYRQSKLTSLLKHSIGGNCYCLMVACISPNDAFLDENLSTLTYATKASKIKNEPMINRNPQHDHILRLENQIQELNKELLKATRNNEIIKTMTGSKTDMEAFLQRADSLFARAEKDKAGSKGESYWEMFLESVGMVRDLLKSNRELREQVERYKSLLDRRDLQVHELFRENEQFRQEIDRFNTPKPMFKRVVKRSEHTKTEHLKTDYSHYQTDGGIFVPIVAMLEKSRNKVILNAFASTELNQKPLTEIPESLKRETKQSFSFLGKSQPPMLRIRTQSSNDQHDDRSIRRRTFQQASPERHGKRAMRLLNT